MASHIRDLADDERFRLGEELVVVAVSRVRSGVVMVMLLIVMMTRREEGHREA